MSRSAIVLLIVASLATVAWAEDGGFKVRFSFTDAVSTKPITGRIVLGFNSDPAKSINNPSLEDPQPTFAWEVHDWKPGEVLVLDRSNAVCWHGDLDSLNGWYAVQAALKTNRRARSYGAWGNAETARSVVFIEKGNMCRPVDLLFNTVWRGPKKFKETEFIKEVNIRSPLLTKFYGEPDSILAAVILPPSYFKESERRYPSVYVVGGWGSTHFDALDPNQHRRYGMSGFGEEKIFVFINGECRSGFHAFASSETNGPREGTFFEELVPYIERTYRVETDPRTRFIMGQSTGAWAALWLLLKRPDQLGGAFAGSPDPVDFTEFTGQTNIYEKNANMYIDAKGEPKRFLPGGPNASPFNMTIEDFTGVDRVAGWGEQMYSFDAAFSPRGASGEPLHLFDWTTGKIDPRVAAAWRSHDLSAVAAGLDGKALQGKIHVYVLDEDLFGLNRPVVPFQKALARKGIAADIRFGQGAGHVVWTDEIRKAMHECIDRTVAEAHAGH